MALLAELNARNASGQNLVSQGYMYTVGGVDYLAFAPGVSRSRDWGATLGRYQNGNVIVAVRYATDAPAGNVHFTIQIEPHKNGFVVGDDQFLAQSISLTENVAGHTPGEVRTLQQVVTAAQWATITGLVSYDSFRLRLTVAPSGTDDVLGMVFVERVLLVE